MRDPNRIEPLLARVAEAWDRYPDLRFGQFMCNFFGSCRCDVFHIEDDYCLAALQTFIDGKDPKEAIENYHKQKYGGSL